ncbi:MAG: patatin-like phospholipase family protein [Sulfurimonas sp.]|nr:patatin-like phospholipase family protein [Sulfurimonas sp.]
MKQKSVSLVLGSGGARGLAHVGIIKYLEENNYKIESISGCSIGALIGGFYASGKLDEYVKWLEGVDAFDMIKLLDLKGSGGLVSGDKLMKTLHNIVGDCDIETLPIKFTAVATDINEEKEIWINKGSLLGAIRASVSLPIFFTPYLHNGKLLVDGGVLNPVPIAPTFHDETDLTIAVNLGAKDTKYDLLEKKIEKNKFKATLKEYLAKLSLPESMFKEDSIYMVANKSFETMQSSIARVKLAAYPPDIEIDIPGNLCATFDFNKSKEIIDYGYKVCKNSLE